MKRPLFCGSAAAVTTPFFADGAVDFETLGRQIEFLLAGGTDGIVSCGTTGESAALSEKERLSVIEYTVWRVGGRVPVIAGTGTNCTAQSVSLTRSAASLGADGILAVCPYYNKPTGEGLYRHFSALADCSALPVILYTVPSRTGVALPVEVAKKLSEHPNVAGLKDASGSLSYGAQIRHACGDDLPLYAGDDATVLPILSLGGVGVISVVANILPRIVHTLCEKWFSGDWQGALELQLRLQPLIAALFAETNPIPVKYALERQGFASQNLRLPLCPLSEGGRAAVDGALSPWIGGYDEI